MPKRYTEKEFQALRKRWDGVERDVIDERLRTGYRRPRLEQFSEEEALTLTAALTRLIPQEEGVDLVGFLDWATGRPMGRGDRQPGMPDEPELFHLGIQGMDQTSLARFGRAFRDLDGSQQDDVLGSLERDRAEGEVWRRVPPRYFFLRFYAKALMGYFSHPRAWMRIGFMGPAYPEGYLWVSEGQVRQRHRRAPGWDSF